MPVESSPQQVAAHDVQARALAAGLVLDAGRADALVPIVSALAEADRRLHALPKADGAAAGPPWGSNERDGGR